MGKTESLCCKLLGICIATNDKYIETYCKEAADLISYQMVALRDAQDENKRLLDPFQPELDRLKALLATSTSALVAENKGLREAQCKTDVLETDKESAIKLIIEAGLSTGHGDTFTDIVKELLLDVAAAEKTIEKLARLRLGLEIECKALRTMLKDAPEPLDTQRPNALMSYTDWYNRRQDLLGD